MPLFRKKTAPMQFEPAPEGEGRKIPIEREELAVAIDPKGQIAEQYRRLRNSIQALNPESASRTVVMTSSIRGEGKSVATLNLALAMAEVEHLSVIVLDGDLRDPSLEGYLGLPRRQGLTEVLTSKIGLDQAIRSTSVKGLDVMSAGEPPDNPPAVLNVDRLQTLMHALKRRYDYILVDTPPALTLNDPSIVGAIADGIILVVRLGSTPRHLVEEAYQLLENVGGNILGTCLTGAHVEAPGYPPY